MRGMQRNFHTRYHVMEATGVFDTNPANPTARDVDGMSLYQGPVQYPKMLYHPKGAERITVPGEAVLSPGGRESIVGEQRELINRIVNSQAEEAEALAEGWHTTPAKAIAAGGRTPPPESPAQVISDKDAEIERLRAQLAEVTAGKPRSGKAHAEAEL